MITVNCAVCFITLLMFAMTVNFNDRFAVQSVARVSYLAYKTLSTVATSFGIFNAIQNPEIWGIISVSVSALILVGLIIHDSFKMKAHREWAEEHAQRPVLPSTTIMLVNAGAASIGSMMLWLYLLGQS